MEPGLCGDGASVHAAAEGKRRANQSELCVENCVSRLFLYSLVLPHTAPPPLSTSPHPKFAEKAKFATTGTPYGMMTVLSSSTVGLCVVPPAQIEVWDWTAGKCVRTLTGFGGNCVFAHALLPDGRFVTGDWAGTIQVASLDNWAAATVIRNGGSGLICTLAGHDGSFVTTDYTGKIELWRNGICEATLTGGSKTTTYCGLSLAVVGRRFVAVGDNNNLLVAE